jgi:glycosyltransferase involved in cell wall biosynthesis
MPSSLEFPRDRWANAEIMNYADNPRVCFLINSYHPIVGGGETHARVLADSLVRLGCKVTVITRRRLCESSRREHFEGYDIHRVSPCRFDRFGKYLMMPGALAKLISLREQYDVIYVCGLRTLGIIGVLAGYLLNKRCILRMESCTEMSGEYATGGYLAADSQKRNRFAVKIIQTFIEMRNNMLCRADRFLAISRVIRDEFLSCGVPSNRIICIPNGIDVTKYVPVDREFMKVLRQKLKLPNGYLFIYTGKLNRGKGLELLLACWKNITSKYNDVCLVLVGAGTNQYLSCEQQLREFVAKHNLGSTVIFTGYVSNVHEYLQASDCFVFPSESEALGLSLIEAMACGLPSIACATGGILDIIEHEKTGLLIEVGNNMALENAMRFLLDQPETARRYASAGRQSVTEKFSIESVTEEHMSMFCSLAAANAH